MFDIAFIDFDDTLFNTFLFNKDIAAVFMHHGVDPEGHRVAMDRALRGESADHYQYSFALHIEKARELGYHLPDSVLDELNALLVDNGYFFEESTAFLQGIQSISDQVFLLTAGNVHFQQQKVDTTPVQKYVDEVVICPGNKGHEVAQRIQKNDMVLFVNDKLHENMLIKDQFPNISVLTKKHPVRSTVEEHENSGIPFSPSLLDLLSFAKQQLSQ